jgi:hypothetical protein
MQINSSANIYIEKTDATTFQPPIIYAQVFSVKFNFLCLKFSYQFKASKQLYNNIAIPGSREKKLKSKTPRCNTLNVISMKCYRIKRI